MLIKIKGKYFLCFLGFVMFLALTTNGYSWGGIVHSRIAEDVALQGGIIDTAIINVLMEQAIWGDSLAAEDGIGTYGIDEEMNPWYDTGSAIAGANADHWLDVTNYDRWWMGPDGEAHNDADEFAWNAYDYFQAGDVDNGFLILGRAAHYVEDVGNPYHTVFWQNLDAYHSLYETWANNQWDALQLSNWARSGAANAHYYNGKTIKQIVVDLAHIAKPLLNSIKNGSYTSNPQATQTLVWYTARALAAVNAKIAPEYFVY